MSRDIFRDAVFGLSTPFEEALSIFETSRVMHFFASSAFLVSTSFSNFFSSVCSSDLVDMFLKCLVFAFLNSLYAVLSLGNFTSSGSFYNILKLNVRYYSIHAV